MLIVANKQIIYIFTAMGGSVVSFPIESPA